MKQLFVFTPLFFVFLLCAANGTSNSSKVSGRITDPAGNPADGASVRLHQTAGAALLATQAGRDGAYSFSDVAAGDYLLEASVRGLAVNPPVALRVRGGRDAEVDVKLSLVTQRSQVTVTAAAAPESLDETSKALDVVEAGDAERRGILSIPDALRQVPGLRIGTRGGPGAFTTIQTRGLRATDTAVLVDGFRLRDATAVQGDASAFIGNLLLVDTSRVEVLQGSGASLYGTNSTAGTVNIITDSGGGPPHGYVDLEGGGLGLFRGLAQVSGGAFHDRLGYSAGLAHLNVTQGVDGGGAARDWFGQSSVTFALTPSIRLNARLFADTGYLQFQTIPYPVNVPATTFVTAMPLSSSQLQLANSGLNFDTAGATFIPALNDPDARRNAHFLSALFGIEQQVTPRFSWRLNYQESGTHRDNIDGPLGPGPYQPQFRTSDLYDGRVDTAQARADYAASSWQSLTAGFEFERESYQNFGSDSNPDPTQRVYSLTNVVQRSNAVFAQDQLKLLSGRLLVLLSGRFQNFQLDAPRFFGGASPYAGIRIPSPADAYTGDASLAYFVHRSSTKFRAHAGNSFREPSVYERFGTYFYGGYFTPYGDPRLSPERAVSADGGIDQYLWGRRLRLSGTFFYSRLQQIIGFDFSGLITPATDPYGRYGGYFNTGGGMAHGVEFSAQFRPSRKTALDASYTYLNARDRISEFSTGMAFNPLQAPQILPHTVTLLATQQLGHGIEAALDFTGGGDYLYPLYGSAYRFDGPRQLGLSANYTRPLNERASLRFYVRVSNALNQAYYEDGFQTPRRWATGGVRLSF